MQRSVALVLSIISFFVFLLLIYYGALVTMWSSFILALFGALILLNLFYPPSQVANDDADYTLVIYALLEIIGVIFLGIYILEKCLVDVRKLEK